MGYGISDYVVFSLVLITCVLIGTYFWFVQKNKNTTEEYLMAGHHMNLFPVIISNVVSYVSAVTMLGSGTEVYFFGITWIFFSVGQVVGILVATFTFVPLFYPLGITSINEYLLLRYNSKIILYCGTFLQLTTMVFESGVIIIAPAYLLLTVAGCPFWASVLIMGLSATIYTAVGGLKAVMWTDTLQAGIMLAGLLTLIIQGTISAGGINEVWQTYEDGGKLDIEVSLNPFKRQDLITLAVVQSPIWTCLYGCRQLAFQRYLSVSSLSRAKGMLLATIPGLVLFFCISCIGGVVAYGYFVGQGCDPFTNGDLPNVNQIIPALMLRVLTYPGTKGLFTAGIFCGALSNLSSFLSALASFTWGDLFAERYKNVSEQKKLLITKLLVVTFGATAMAVTFLLNLLGGPLIQMIATVSAVLTISFTTLFLLGASLPFINFKNAITTSFIVGGFILWLTIGSTVNKVNTIPEPLPTYNCTQSNSSIPITANPSFTTHYPLMTYPTDAGNGNTVHESSGSSAFWLYKISYLWWHVIGFTMAFIISLVIACIPVFKEKQHIEDRLLFPIVRWYRKSKQHRNRKHHHYQLTPSKEQQDQNIDEDISQPKHA